MLVKLEAYHDGDDGCARGIGEGIFTQGKTCDELIENVKEAVVLHFEDAPTLPEVLLLLEPKLTGAATSSKMNALSACRVTPSRCGV
jgi:hypothetical protein